MDEGAENEKDGAGQLFALVLPFCPHWMKHNFTAVATGTSGHIGNRFEMMKTNTTGLLLYILF